MTHICQRRNALKRTASSVIPQIVVSYDVKESARLYSGDLTKKAGPQKSIGFGRRLWDGRRIREIREHHGIRLDHFAPGQQYEMGNTLGALFLAEGWAEPVPSDEPALLIPLTEFAADAPTRPTNLVREFWPPYYQGPSMLAADRRRIKRPRRRPL